MTDLTTPAEKFGGVNNETMAHAMAKSGGHDGYVVNGTDMSPNFPSLDETGVNGFENASNSSLSATFDGGEAFLYGWLCRDRQTTVDLPASTTTTVYVGFDLSAALGTDESPADSENVILGVDGDFADIDPQLPIYDITTDGSSVIGVDDRRPLGRDSASAPWASDYEHPDTLDGLMTFTGSFREHIRLDRSEDDVGVWDLTPTTRNGGGLLFSRNDDSETFEMTNSGEIITNDGDHFAKTGGDSMRLVISSSEPSDYDVWFEVS